MFDNVGTKPIIAAISLFIFNIACVGIIAAAAINLKLYVIGLLLIFAVVSLALIGALLFLKYNHKIVNSFSDLSVIVEHVIAKTNQPLTICKHTVASSGLVKPKVVYANTAFFETTNTSQKDIIGKDTPYIQDVSDVDRKRMQQAFQDGESFSTRIIEKDSNGDMFETELNISPIHINNKIEFWVGYRTFIQSIDSNIIKLGNHYARSADRPRLD